MAVRPLVLFPDPRLSQPSKSVISFGPRLCSLIEDLKDTLNHLPGVGLAAPQIGIMERVSIVDVTRYKRNKNRPSEASHGLLVLINPTLIKSGGEQIPREGCLSVPDLLANIRRYQTVVVKTWTDTGREEIIEATGFEALALQHEMDHLDGKLFLDRVVDLRTDIFRRKSY